jgi:hypothetical protein
LSSAAIYMALSCDRSPKNCTSHFVGRGPSTTDPVANEPDRKQKPGKITPFDLIRAISTIIVFGVPLVAGTTAILGYGIYTVFKKLKK